MSSNPPVLLLFFYFATGLQCQSTALCSVSLNQRRLSGRKKERPHGVSVRCSRQVSLPLKGEAEGKQTSEGKLGVCDTEQEGIHPQEISCSFCLRFFFFFPAFLFHTPHGWRTRRLLCFYLQASGAAQVTVAGCV